MSVLVSRQGRLRVLAVATTAVAASLLAACSSAKPGASSTDAHGLTMWALNDQTVLADSVKAYNSDHPKAKITLQLLANDDYKQKLRVAFGAGKAPDIFFSWGGGALNDYVKAGKVARLQPSQVNSSRFTPSVLSTATFDGKVYGVPCNGLAPVVLYYNKKVLESAGVQPPATFADLLSAVKTLKAKNVIPISLAAGSQWPTLMFEEYLLDRVGGPQVFSAIENGDKSAWTKPAVATANQRLRELVAAGAFGSNASSVSYDQGASTALVYTGKAAMELMGTWEYANFQKANPGFVKSDLGWTTFPTVEGGSGDGSNIVGNPSNFLSVNAATKNKSAAMDYLKNYVMNKSQISTFLSSGSVPPINNLESTITASNSADEKWLLFVYRLVANAKSFQLSWDQALPSSAATPLLTNINKVFLGQLSPSQFGTDMSKVN